MRLLPAVRHALRPASGAEIGVGADEHPPARIVGDDLVQIAVVGAAEVAVMRGLGRLRTGDRRNRG